MMQVFSISTMLEFIGTSIASIKEGEDRDSFKQLMERTNQPIVESDIVTDVESAVEFAEKIGYPVIVRPAYTIRWYWWWYRC